MCFKHNLLINVEFVFQISSEDEFIIHGSGDTGVTCELIVTKDTDCEIGRLNNNFEVCIFILQYDFV